MSDAAEDERAGLASRGRPTSQLASVLVALGLSLSACGIRPTNAVLEPVAIDGTAPNARSVEFLVATTRKNSPSPDSGFTSDRRPGLAYVSYAVSVPPAHRAGQIEYPDATRNPATSFVVTKARKLDQAGFRTAIAARGRGDVLVFIHGYNTNYPESVFRFAELINDATAPGRSPDHVDVLFAWPSRGELTGYLADRESANFSRNYLESALNEIASTPGVRNIDLVAHSMGNWLAVETLRQAKLRVKAPFLAKLRGVTLVAPDIDVDVFATQLDTIGQLREPITVVVNKHDLALATSQYLAGEISRVGNTLIDKREAQAAIRKYGLRVVDLSDVTDEDPLKHSTFIKALPALERVVQGHALSGSSEASGLRVLVADAAGKMLSAPLRVGRTLVSR
jgi:esterase/lipase superfamily enzyme